MTRPLDLADGAVWPHEWRWVLALVCAVDEYEATHGHPNEGWECLASALDGVPPGVLERARGFHEGFVAGFAARTP